MRRWIGVLLAVGGLFGCAGVARTPRVEPFRISHVVEQGDAARRASTRLILGGLDAEAGGNVTRGRSLFERALQVDPTNPYAFLALARSAQQRGAASQCEHFLEQAEASMRLEGAPPGAFVHIDGLRGVLGSAQGLQAAERASPAVWGDGKLDARELR
ncbi:MAG: hypothetical protein GY723_02375 [bacterium]|nr:hypothetical protein [bacterium]MCP5069010.1 hypothetical protein [bacterium]